MCSGYIPLWYLVVIWSFYILSSITLNRENYAIIYLTLRISSPQILRRPWPSSTMTTKETSRRSLLKDLNSRSSSMAASTRLVHPSYSQQAVKQIKGTVLHSPIQQVCLKGYERMTLEWQVGIYFHNRWYRLWKYYVYIIILYYVYTIILLCEYPGIHIIYTPDYNQAQPGVYPCIACYILRYSLVMTGETTIKHHILNIQFLYAAFQFKKAN